MRYKKEEIYWTNAGKPVARYLKKLHYVQFIDSACLTKDELKKFINWLIAKTEEP